jgi:alpha-1,2-mannosyltransferase
MSWLLKKKAVAIHHTLNTIGGETAVALETIELLHELGYDVQLVTVQKPDLKATAKAYGRDEIPVSKVVSLLPFKLNYFGIYQRLLTLLPSLGIDRHSDLVINTHGNALPYSGISKVPYMIYLHFPTLLIRSPEYMNLKYQNSLFWKAYLKPYQVMLGRLSKKAIRKSKLILTNSEFSRNAIKKLYPDSDPQILYPPVDVDRFSPAFQSPTVAGSRQVLVVSRLSPEKQVENAVRAAAKLPPDIKFHITGSLVPSNRGYFKMLKKMVRDRGLDGRISIQPNATNQELMHAMSDSSVYLHTMVGEHFGVSIIEAMAAGLVPIVPSYGGCSEIVPSDYQYDTIEEAAARIEKNIAESSAATRQQMHDAATQFSSAKFKRRMERYINLVSGITPPRPSTETAEAG